MNALNGDPTYTLLPSMNLSWEGLLIMTGPSEEHSSLQSNLGRMATHSTPAESHDVFASSRRGPYS